MTTIATYPIALSLTGAELVAAFKDGRQVAVPAALLGAGTVKTAFWDRSIQSVPSTEPGYVLIRIPGAAVDGSQDTYGQVSLIDIAGITATALAAVIALPSDTATVSSVLLAMSLGQRQSLRASLETVDDMDEVAIRLRGQWVQQGDALGQFIGAALFGSATDPSLSNLFSIAHGASAPPFTYNLAPIALGGILTDA